MTADSVVVVVVVVVTALPASSAIRWLADETDMKQPGALLRGRWFRLTRSLRRLHATRQGRYT
jgi:hypothetical protein